MPGVLRDTPVRPDPHLSPPYGPGRPRLRTTTPACTEGRRPLNTPSSGPPSGDEELLAERGRLSGPDPTVRPRRTTKLTITEDFAAPPGDVYALGVSRAGFEAAMPAGVRVLSWPEAFEAGAVLAFQWRVAGLLPLRWIAVIDAHDEGRSFADLQTRGPFRYFRHTHRGVPRGNGTRYTDELEFSTGFGPPGDLVAAAVIRAAFGPRLRRMRAALERRGSG